MSFESIISQLTELLDNSFVLLGFALGVLVLGGGAYFVSPHLGWRRTPALLAGLGAALALAVTLSKGAPGTGHAGTEFCSVSGISQYTLFGSSELLNMLMLGPFAFCAVLATRRALIVLATSILLSVVIELTQAVAGLGVCTSGDLFHNSLGAAVAVGIAATLNARTHRAHPVDASEGSDRFNR